MTPLPTTVWIARRLLLLLLVYHHHRVVVHAATVVTPRLCGGAIRHVHLSVGPDPATSMIVTFASIPSQYAAPVGGVLLGTVPGDLTERVVVEDEPPTGYNLTVTQGGNYGNSYVSPHYHHVVVRNLQPNTTYYYQPQVHYSRAEFGNYNRNEKSKNTHFHWNQSDTFASEQEMEQALDRADQKGNKEKDDSQRLLLEAYDGSARDCPSPDRIRSFKTAPKLGSDTLNLAIIGDLGQFAHSIETLLRLQRDREHVDAILLIGDIAYTEEDHRRWDTFFDFLDDYPVVDRIPLQICPGNHDIDKVKDRSEIFLAYENRFRMPRVRPPELGLYDGPTGHLNMDAPPYPLPYEWGNAYYSYSYGPAHIIMISAYSSMEPNSTQYRWIQQELDSVDRTVTPWVLAMLHVPIYNTFSLHHHDLQIAAAKQHLEPLFIQHKVNMVFSGHIHAYQRTAAVAMNVPTPTAPVYITVGAGGRKCEAPFSSKDPEPWALVRDATWFGYGMLRIVNRTTAVWDWIHTSQTDGRTYNQVVHSNETLPSGPSRDHVVFRNQLYL
jgi:acid phosphatase type 7